LLLQKGRIRVYISREMSDERANGNTEKQTSFIVSLIAGGLAGTSVDVALFPIDTIKTRLQSPQGFRQAGGFNGIYRGLGATAIGSAPGAAIFFSVYESLKPKALEFQRDYGLWSDNPALSHMLSASAGETAACLIRVPTEVLKTQMQVSAAGTQTVSSTLKMVLAQKNNSFNALGGLYRGFGSTVMREIPFAFIQFPIYERSKVEMAKYLNKNEVSPIQAAACGSFGGSIAAAMTTPLDVIKTRLMLGKCKNGIEYKNVLDVVKRIRAEEGIPTFINGIQPRVMWISIGGFVFFGAYETYKSALLSTGM